MSVLFVMPPGGAISFFSEHLGTAFLRTMLGRAGIPSQQYLPDRNVSLPAFARFLEERRLAIVGFTAYETNLRACRAMARVVRETLPEAIVMVGGPNATFSPEETLDLLGADLCLRGAGEGTIVAIVQAILGADRPRRRLPDLVAEIPNLVIRAPGGARRTRAGALSSFPSEYFRCLDDIPSPYQSGFVATADVGVLTARGCNQGCTYCSFATISNRRVHYHGVERVLDDLAAFRAVLARVERRRATIAICDDAFTLAPRRAQAICEGIIERGLQMPLECETRADRVDAGLLRLMRRAGFVAIAFGLESGVPRVLRAIGKVQDPTTPDDPGFEAERAYLESFRAAITAAKDAGLSPSVSVIGGLPAETADDFRATLAFVESLRLPLYVHNVLTLLPGTPLYQDRERHGLRAGREAGSGLWQTRHAYDVHSVPPLKSSQLHALRWDEANLITDALCGRPQPARAGDDGAWAVVLHAAEPSPGVAAWLHQVLAVQGAVVVVNAAGPCHPEDHASWLRILNQARVPWGLLALLSLERATEGLRVLRSLGTLGEHRFEVDARWESSGRSVDVDQAGNCRVPIWVASAAPSPPTADGEPALLRPTPQIADGCRWWSGWRRCRHPRVLHASPHSTVRPCWHGPAIGRVGDPYGDLVARGRALGRGAPAGTAWPSDRCPLAGSQEGSEASKVAEEHEVAAQLSWLLRQDADAR
jgi:radical SAM superfamily enzyme YgiQ (UPF0313 family)